MTVHDDELEELDEIICVEVIEGRNRVFIPEPKWIDADANGPGGWKYL